MTGSAKQSMRQQAQRGLLRRFAPLRKRFAFVAGNDVEIQTLRYNLAISPRKAPEFCYQLPALSSEGAGNAGRQVRPQPRV
jgi:hypothetical protein